MSSMPVSKSKRKRYQPPPKKKPKPSPKWFGGIILGLLFGGVYVILAYYGLLPGGGDVAGSRQFLLWGGLGLIAVGFGAATQWR
jgi:hypothetical protein